MERVYAIKHPDQLKAISEFRKDCTQTKMINTARIWSAEKRQKETTPWDGRFFAAFVVKGRERSAYVFRLGPCNEKCILGWLKYAPTLKWCKENLEAVE